MWDCRSGTLAAQLMNVAESRSIETFGAACAQAIGWLTGSSIVGLYLLDGEEPRPDLLYSRHVPTGFLEEYRNGMAKNDPHIDYILQRGRSINGIALHGRQNWRASQSYGLLSRWGLSCNMCGPFRDEDRIIGIFYTATRDTRIPYDDDVHEAMDLLCRAGSVALSVMLRSGALDHAAGVSGNPLFRPGPSLHDLLPPRSAEVAFRVCRGQTNKEIARDMGISDQTVKEHVTNLFRRFGAHNRTELVTCLLSGMSRQ